jgi:hypothetical protein
MTRLTLTTAILVALGTLACGPKTAEAHRPTHGHWSPQAEDMVSVTLEQPGGGALPTYWHRGAAYAAGQEGERYNIRLANRSGERVEVVVTVDGRDAVSGELGDYRRQRGYVLEPWGTMVVEGFRRSLDEVAAFRFSSVGESYTARRGTPQHAGVIGVAVFREAQPRHRYRHRPVQTWEHRPDPYPSAPSARDYDAKRGVDGDGEYAPRDAAPPSAGAAESAAPEASARLGGGRSRADRGWDEGGARFAPAPHNELGTEYGESQYSSVREVEFRRRSSRRPDEMITLYYDSFRGLRARGVIVEPVDPPYQRPYEPEPFPSSRGFAPPPPPRY